MLETSDWNNRHNSATEGGPVRIETDSTRRSSSQDSRESKSDSGQSKQAANSCEDMIVEAVDPNVNLYSSATNQQVRSAMDAFQAFRYLSGTFVNSEKVQLFIVSLIAINALMMGIATFDFVREDPSVNNAFEIVDQIFLIIFTIELAMQFAYHGWRLLLDGWLCFDLIVIAMSWSFSSVQIIRAFRIFRALRLITRIKVMKNLVLALFGVMPRMFAIGLLLFLVSYIFAVMFTQLFKDLGERGLTDADYFGRIDDTFFTLFQIMTLDGWADIARQVMEVYPWAWLPFIVFVIITGFVVVNLIIAVICDAISALHDDEKAKLHGTYEDDGTLNHDESVRPAVREDVRAQLDVLEDHVEELTRMQEETLLTLEALTRQLQTQNAAESMHTIDDHDSCTNGSGSEDDTHEGEPPKARA
jgi:uncharacterized membrane protein YphA (DoxX/SURF4 family)